MNSTWVDSAVNYHAMNREHICLILHMGIHEACWLQAMNQLCHALANMPNLEHDVPITTCFPRTSWCTMTQAESRYDSFLACSCVMDHARRFTHHPQCEKHVWRQEEHDQYHNPSMLQGPAFNALHCIKSWRGSGGRIGAHQPLQVQSYKAFTQRPISMSKS